MTKTEAEKMLAGEWYDPYGQDFERQRVKARNLLEEFNACPDAQQREDIARRLLGSVGQRPIIIPPFSAEYGNKIFLGDDCGINMNVTFLDGGEIRLGDRVIVAPDVKIYTVEHPQDPTQRWKEGVHGRYIETRAKNVTIDHDTWICGNVTILPGVHIGANTIIGAGSVVTKDIPDNVVAAGNPCRVIRANNK